MSINNYKEILTSMGLNIMRIIKAFKGKTDKYEGTIQCSKKLNETLDFIKTTWTEKSGKSLYRAGKFRVVKDVNWNTWHEIELQVKNSKGDVFESIVFRVQHYQGIVNQITLDLDAIDSKATFEDFKKDLEALADVKAAPAPASAPVQEIAIDFSNKTMAEALGEFEEAVNAFGENVNASTFAKVKAVRNAINQKIKLLDAKEKAAFMSCLSKIDTFVNAINMQLSNPAMASSVATFASTYVSQMLSEIAQMQAIC